MRKFKQISFISLITITIVMCVGTNIEAASTQEDRFPSKPIKFIIREGPGGTTDLAYRALTRAAEKILGQQIICNNIPGGGGTRSLTALLQEKSDGYALGTFTTGTLIIAHVEKPKFSILNDFTLIMQVLWHPMPLAVRKDAPWKTWQELIKFAREHEGEVKVAVWGAYSTGWLCLQKIEEKEKVKFTYVPFLGTGEAMTALLGGHIDISTFASGIMYSQSGELRTLLLLAGERMKVLPGVPTAKELYGDWIGFTGGSTGIVAPKGLPEPILIRLQGVFKKAIGDPDFLKVIERLNLLISYKDAEEYRKEIKNWDDEIKKIIK